MSATLALCTPSNFATSFSIFAAQFAQSKSSKIIQNSISKFELEYGIACGEENPAWNCQWDYPNIWAPIQYVVYKGLINYGYFEDAKRVASKYVALIEKNFAQTGNLWEKYNGHTAENVSAEYDAPKMLGWTAGVYIYFCNELGL